MGERLLVLAPHWLERREPSWNERRSLDVLERALDEFTELRTNRDCVLELQARPVETNDPLIASHRTWLSVAPYAVTRHAKRLLASQALAEDVIRECQRRALPRPEVAVIDTRGVAGQGLEGSVRLEFAVAVGGPIILGRTRYLGGGLFAGAP